MIQYGLISFVGIIWMRGKVLAWVAGRDSRHLLFFMKHMTLSVFVDESGRFQHPDPDSRFYILGMVFHDQGESIAEQIEALARSEVEIDIEGHCFHAGPLIRKEKGYEFMSRRLRGRIFSRMMAFASKTPFRYHCLCVDKKLIDSARQIVTRLQRELVAFIDDRRDVLENVDSVKVYYDCGQSPVTNLLHKTFEESLGSRVSFAQGVHPADYRLFQLADLVCTLHLIERRLETGLPMTKSEIRFFGGPRDFKRNVLRKIKGKEI